MIVFEKTIERLNSFDSQVKTLDKKELRDLNKQVGFLTVERDTYQEEAIRLSQENARLTDALAGKDTPVVAEIDPIFEDRLVERVRKALDRIAFDEVTRVTVVSDKGVEFEKYDLYLAGVELNLQDGGKTLKIFPRPEAF